MSAHRSAAGGGTRERARAWLRTGAFTALALLSALGPVALQQPGMAGAAFAREPIVSAGHAEWVGAVLERARLPGEARTTLNLIAAGGPYPYAKDGTVFRNFERLLPVRPRGYYHEYTVPTPRARNRGARRIVCGGSLRRTDDCFYTDDHYNSFKRIVE